MARITPRLSFFLSHFDVFSHFILFILVQYGSGSVLAFEASDDVCLDKSGKICTNTVFANVVMQHGLDGLQADGIVGLAPTAHTNQQNYTSILFVEKLYSEGKINKPLFSLMIDSNDEVDSKITIGGFNSTKYAAQGSEMAWHDL